jgi:general secretion pathway protein D
MKFIEIVSHELKKNIVLTQKIEGEIDFIGNHKLTHEALFELLKTLLKQKGFRLEKVEATYYIKPFKKAIKKEVLQAYEMQAIQLQFAHINEVFELANAFIEQSGTKKNQIVLLKDEVNNTLMVYGNKKNIQMIQTLIRHLDKEHKQVYVKTKILEISESKLSNLGLKYGLDKLYTSSSGNIFTLGTNLGGSVNALSNQFTSLFQMTPQTLNSAVALGATLSLLKTNHVIDIVSQPSLLCINNQESSIYVGETKSFQTGLNLTDGGNQNSTFQRENIGLTLKVTPRITNENQVTLDILTIVEDAKALQANQINPDTTKKEIKTRAVVNNAQSVILGGLIKSKQDFSEQKVPFFGDIPLLGALFKHEKEFQDRVNLVVIVTPYIVNHAFELTQIKHALAELQQLEQKHSKNIEKRLLAQKKKQSGFNTVTHQKKETPNSAHELHLQMLQKL